MPHPDDERIPVLLHATTIGQPSKHQVYVALVKHDEENDYAVRHAPHVWVSTDTIVAAGEDVGNAIEAWRKAPEPAPLAESSGNRRQEVIEQLCKIMGRAWNAIDPVGHYACDCVCQRKYGRYQNTGEALAFIEEAVSVAISNRPIPQEGHVPQPAPVPSTSPNYTLAARDLQQRLHQIDSGNPGMEAIRAALDTAYRNGRDDAVDAIRKACT